MFSIATGIAWLFLSLVVLLGSLVNHDKFWLPIAEISTVAFITISGFLFKANEAKKDKWRKGKWTKDKVDALELILDGHTTNCDDCSDLMSEDPPKGYCPVGESLSEEWLQASTEFSWQPDFLKDKNG